jgi:hypothetical protein
MAQRRGGCSALLRAVPLAVVAAGVVACSSAKSPEDFCAGWVERACATASTCCASGTLYDHATCQGAMWVTCVRQIPVEQVHSGEVVFDSDAAGECAGEILSCADLSSTQTIYQRQKACGTMVTGFRPVGAACTASSECEKSGDFAHCWDGFTGNGGICVKPRLSEDNTCSFRFDTMELLICPDGTFCDTSGWEPTPTDPPSVQQYEFAASCRAYLLVGDNCGTTDTLRCGAGLYCAYDGTCTAYATQGQSCDNGEQCGPGLDCRSAQGGSTCQPYSSFCYSNPVCGDGVCDTGEQQSCPQDCGGGCGATGDYCYQPSDCCSNNCSTTTYQCT